MKRTTIYLLIAFLIFSTSLTTYAAPVESMTEFYEVLTNTLDVGNDEELAKLVTENPEMAEVASEYFKQLAEEEPENSNNWILLSNLLDSYLAGEHPLADAAASQNPDDECYGLFMSATDERDKGEYQNALNLLESARECELKNTGGDESINSADCLNEIGLIYMDVDYPLDAEAVFDEAIGAYGKLSESEAIFMARALSNSGYASYRNGKYEKSAARFKEAKEILDKINPDGGMETVMTMGAEGESLRALGNYEQAEAVFDEALGIAEKLELTGGYEIETLYNNIGALYEDEGRFEPAMDFYERALEISIREKGKNHFDTAIKYGNIASVQGSLADYENALANFQKSLGIMESITGSDNPYVATTYNNIGDIQRSMGRFEEAIQSTSKSLEITLKISGEKSYEAATAYNNLGSIYLSLGDYDGALKNLRRAMDIFREIYGERHPSTATAMSNLGAAYGMAGDYSSALTFQNKAVDVLKNIYGEKHPNVVPGYNNLGSNYISQGDYDSALEYLQKAHKYGLELYGEKHPSIAMTYNNLGGVYDALGDRDKALEYYQKSLDVRLSVLGEDHPDTVHGYNNIGFVYQELNDYDRANEYYEKALKVTERFFGKNHPLAAVAYNNEGSLLREKKEFAAALEKHRAALASLCEGKENPEAGDCRPMEETVKAYLFAAECFYQTRDYANSVRSYENAAVSLEMLRNEMSSDDSKKAHGSEYANMFSEGIKAYRALAEETGDEKYFEEAFEFAEKGMGRVFLEMLGGRAAGVKGGLPDEVISEWLEIYAEWIWVKTDVEKEERAPEGQRNLGKIKELFRKYNIARKKLEDYEDGLYEKYPQYAALVKPGAVSLADVRKTVLMDDEAILEYILGKNESYLLYLTKSEIAIYPLPPGEEIENLVDIMRSKLTTPAYNETSYSKTAGKLYDILIAPLEEKLSGVTRLLIIPTGKLNFLPFEALKKSGSENFVASRFETRYAPGLSILKMVKDRGAPQYSSGEDWLGFGDPVYEDDDPRAGGNGFSSGTIEMNEGYERAMALDGNPWKRIPGTGAEVRGIEKKIRDSGVGKTALEEGMEASEWNFKYAAMSGAKYIHVAAHGTLGEGGAMQPAVVLTLAGNEGSGEDGFLTMEEVLEMRVPAEMVVLSACGTGRGKMEKGEGVSGMARAFMYAGADSVVVSLWNVADEQTKDMMMSFYGKLLEGMDKPGALAAARREMIDKEFSPYYWAPFVFSGVE